MNLIEYHHPQFSGKVVTCHKGFAPYLDKMGEHAKGLGITIVVTSSYRTSTDVKGAIVKPATKSNHMIGFAIDCNLQVGKKIWNSEALKNPDTTIRSFIQLCIADGMRWGGNFASAPDPVHFDVGINLQSGNKWEQYFKEVNTK